MDTSMAIRQRLRRGLARMLVDDWSRWRFFDGLILSDD